VIHRADVRAHYEEGQSIVLSVFFLTALMGMAAFVVDACAWFRASRQVQSVADSAALAGAQAIPSSPDTARSLAIQYANHNGGGVASADVSFATTYRTNDTIVVTARKTEQGFFSKIFHIDSVNISTTTKAVAADLSQATNVAPFVVNAQHPMLAGNGCPCFNQYTTITEGTVGPGNFGIVNLDGSRGGTSPGSLADWITGGSPGPIGLGWYYGDPGAKFNSSQVKSALDSVLGHILLFPVEDNTQGNGANFQYHIIGFVGFKFESYVAHGNSADLNGEFDSVIWQGLPDTTGGVTDYGAHTVFMTQ
jgi:Flp pilus assembly protein TadG